MKSLFHCISHKLYIRTFYTHTTTIFFFILIFDPIFGETYATLHLLKVKNFGHLIKESKKYNTVNHKHIP